ncbi:MAG: hypothetical protein RBT63_08020 [Bdellovibrionales bacterium]|nr:hypothetical protein [Bdellovibrionales bacterium]
MKAAKHKSLKRSTKAPVQRKNKQSTGEGESDAVSLWLILLFVATFFGIAAEESRHPSTFSKARISNGIIGDISTPLSFKKPRDKEKIEKETAKKEDADKAVTKRRKN